MVDSLALCRFSSRSRLKVNPSDVGIYDRVVVQEMIKTVASAQQINPSAGTTSASSHDDGGGHPSSSSGGSKAQQQGPCFKVVVLTEVDRLTKDAQHALRRTMEKYTSTCRLILITSSSTSKVTPAIRSRCLGIRVAAPTVAEVVGVLTAVAKREGCGSLPSELARRIAEQSGRNLRRALLTLEACKVAQYPFQADQKIPDLDWEEYLKATARLIVEEQTPGWLLEVRSRLYELLTHCIPADVIFV